MGKTILTKEKIDPRSQLPGQNAVNNAVIELSNSVRGKSMSNVQDRIPGFGPAASVDSVYLKLQV